MANASPRFDTTFWSQVLLAARKPGSESGHEALSRLCAAYWYPVYAFVRRQGRSPVDAQDLTQGFFEQILSSDFLAKADPGKGRFRSFLMGAVKNHLANDRERKTAQRRGGGRPEIPIDSLAAEQWLSAEPTAVNDSTKAFDRSWAVTVLDHATEILEGEQRKAGKAQIFTVLKEFLQRAANPGEYDKVASQLGMNKGAVAVAVHRLNERFGELVRNAVRETIADPQMAEEELRYLYSALHN